MYIKKVIKKFQKTQVHAAAENHMNSKKLLNYIYGHRSKTRFTYYFVYIIKSR